jgi:ribokinase
MSNATARIAVVGSYAVGMTMSCSRFPGEGETVTGRNFKLLHGGKGSNQAIAVARLGGEALFGAALGADDFGDAALAMLRAEGVNADFVVRKPAAPTGVGIILVSDKGSNEIVIDLGANESLSIQDIERMGEAIATCDLLLVQLEANLEAVSRAVDIAHARGVPIVLNPAPFRNIQEDTIRKATYLTPNETEAAALLALGSGEARDGQSLARLLHEKYGTSVIVTLGELGAHAKTLDLDLRIPAFPARTVDTTGAGDTFSAAFAVAVGEGRGIAEAIAFANMAAGMSVEIEGVVPSIPRRRDVEARLAASARKGT